MKRKQDDLYRAYIGKAAEMLVLNTANIAAGERQGFSMSCSWADFIEPKTKVPEKEQTPAEIKKKILDRFKQLGGGK